MTARVQLQKKTNKKNSGLDPEGAAVNRQS
jgi:hypothetical protein